MLEDWYVLQPQWNELEALVQNTEIKTVIAPFPWQSIFHKILYWPHDTAEKAITRSSEFLGYTTTWVTAIFFLTFLMDEDRILYEGIPL